MTCGQCFNNILYLQYTLISWDDICLFPQKSIVVCNTQKVGVALLGAPVRTPAINMWLLIPSVCTHKYKICIDNKQLTLTMSVHYDQSSR